MNVEDWAWVFRNGDGSAYWEEEAEFDRWVEAGSPPMEEWQAGRSSPAPAMPLSPKATQVPEFALTVSRDQAALLLQVSPDHFRRHVLPEIRAVQVGARQLIPVREIEDYINRKSARALKD
jgi:hypothetical protein